MRLFKKIKSVKYWIGTVSREHGMNAVKESIVQVCHGKAGLLRKMRAGDWFAYYSPGEKMGGKSDVQRFVCMGRVKTGNVYQVEQFPGFKPFRLDVQFMQCQETEIKPLISELDFIKNKQKWGMTFRFGCIEVAENDFKKIADAMNVNLDNPIPVSEVSEKKREKTEDEIKTKEIDERSRKKVSKCN
jgi:predicted RNA-binding protein